MEMEEAKMEIFTNPVRQYPRSNARSRYGKSAGRPAAARRTGYARRGNAGEKPAAPSSFKERTIFQAIICGGFLAVLLFFNIIDTGFTNSVTDWINRNISYDMLAQEGGIGGWVDSVLGIFNNENDTADVATPTYYETRYYEGTGTDAIPAQTITPRTNTVDSSRVDENILREINSAGD